jgi:F5/8 type C domain-containing protein
MRPKSLLSILTLLVVVSLVASAGWLAPLPAKAQTQNLALNKPVTCSPNPQFPCAEAVDGNLSTRWASAQGLDPQWIYVDLGATTTISHVILRWETAYGKAYQIQTSNDATNWTNIFSTTAGDGGVDDLTGLSGSGRYVRMNGTVRGTGYGYSLWEFEIYGGTSPTNTPANTPTKTNTPASGCGTTNAALNKPTTASSTENAGTPASAAVDGSTTTRWSSAFSDPQWIYVDLGSTQSICHVKLNWEAAYGKSYQIQTSPNATSWTNIYSTTTGDGGIDDLTGLSGSGRYIRMNGTVRGTGYGYSLWEFEIYTGSGGPTNTPTATPTKTNTPIGLTNTPTRTPTASLTNTPGGSCTQPANPSFGPNTHIFDTSMSAATIQSQLDADFNLLKDTQTAQFAENRRAELFKPGTYNVTANVGFYESVAGLGLNPTDVTINGDVTVDAFNASDAGNATQNFWRSAENLTINPSAGADRWAVAQAAPFRRIQVNGGLNVFPASYGWASGGYISDVKVTGQVASASQQQWYSKDSNFGSWSGSVWNMVFSGVTGAPAPSFPTPPMTVLGTTPVSRDVPYLYVDGTGAWRVFLPNLRTNASGTSWPNTPGSSLPITQFYVVIPGATTANIVNALNSNCNLLFTPGVYHINQTLNITRAGTIVLGLGYPTIVNDGGVDAIHVADVDGVRLKGLLLDAGTTQANALLTIGTAGNTTSHASNPVSIQDLFFRIGGEFAGKVTNSLIVNSYDTIIDHIWAWRADHGSGVGWTSNTADQGLVVNGNNVLATGLFVEHYQKYEVTWNGQNGKIIFFQNEMPYDPPNQAAYMNGTTRGYAAIKVANSVTAFEAWGLGSYCYFVNSPGSTNIVSDRAYEAPNVAGVKWHNLSTVSLGNNGAIINVINTTGPQTPTNSTPATVTNYP